MKDIESAVKAAGESVRAGAEMIELRVDYLENLSKGEVVKLVCAARESIGATVPVIVTCREKKEGGAIEYPDKLRVETLCEAIKAGAEFVDFEFANFLETTYSEKLRAALLSKTDCRLILSAHNFKSKFENPEQIYEQILKVYPKAIPKLVYKANHINDCFAAFDLLHNTRGKRIIFCMGEAGLISRILAKKLGSMVTFASIDEGKGTAPGQVTLEKMMQLYRCETISSETEIYGIIGSPVGHSLSPAIHNACFEKIGANKVYLPLWVDGGKNEFDLFMQNIINRGWLGFRGLSVTLPHKHNAIEFVKENGGEVEKLAERIGAANTLVLDVDGKVKAYNSDYAGALDAITETLGIKRTEMRDMRAAVIGAGGVGRAIVAGLKDVGAKVKIFNRTIEKGAKLAGEFGCDFGGLDDIDTREEDLLVNCTSLGMYPKTNDMPVAASILRKETAVFDTVYNPIETRLIKEAKMIGARTINGAEMFIEQAKLQFKLFTGVEADSELMRQIVYEKLKSKKH